MFKSIYKNVILPACGIFSALVLFISGSAFLLDKDAPAIPCANLLIMALIALAFALINLIYKIKQLKFYFKMATHFIFSSLAVYGILLWTSGMLVSSTKNLRLIVLLAYIIIYVIVATIIICVKERKKAKAAIENANNQTTQNNQ